MGYEVTQTGEVVDYRRSEAAPAIAVSAVERRDSADWFDLHLTVSVDGEAVPFDELFVALAGGEDYLILETGVYFALDRPEFGRLRDLIEESKALQDRERPELMINRFQASLWEDLVDLGVVIDQSAAWSKITRGLRDVTSVEPVPAPATLTAAVAPVPARRVSLAQLPVRPSAGWHPGRRHGAGQDRPGAGTDLPRGRRQAGGTAVPGRRAHQCGVELGS